MIGCQTLDDLLAEVLRKIEQDLGTLLGAEITDDQSDGLRLLFFDQVNNRQRFHVDDLLHRRHGGSPRGHATDDFRALTSQQILQNGAVCIDRTTQGGVRLQSQLGEFLQNGSLLLRFMSGRLAISAEISSRSLSSCYFSRRLALSSSCRIRSAPSFCKCVMPRSTPAWVPLCSSGGKAPPFQDSSESCIFRLSQLRAAWLILAGFSRINCFTTSMVILSGAC